MEYLVNFTFYALRLTEMKIFHLTSMTFYNGYSYFLIYSMHENRTAQKLYIRKMNNYHNSNCLIHLSKWLRDSQNFLSEILFCFFISDTILPNVIESQYCTAHLHRPASDCLVNSTVVPQTDIQTFTSTLQMIRTSIEVTIPCILSFFFGPWSDKYGRRPLLISAGCGKGGPHKKSYPHQNIFIFQPAYFFLGYRIFPQQFTLGLGVDYALFKSDLLPLIQRALWILWINYIPVFGCVLLRL